MDGREVIQEINKWAVALRGNSFPVSSCQEPKCSHFYWYDEIWSENEKDEEEDIQEEDEENKMKKKETIKQKNTLKMKKKKKVQRGD